MDYERGGEVGGGGRGSLIISFFLFLFLTFLLIINANILFILFFIFILLNVFIFFPPPLPHPSPFPPPFSLLSILPANTTYHFFFSLLHSHSPSPPSSVLRSFTFVAYSVYISASLLFTVFLFILLRILPLSLYGLHLLFLHSFSIFFLPFFTILILLFLLCVHLTFPSLFIIISFSCVPSTKRSSS